MRRRTGLLLMADSALVVLSLALLALRVPEPTYRGKTLAQWTENFSPNPAQQDKEAVAAVQALCTNDLPALVVAINYDADARREKFYARLAWLPTFVPRFLQYQVFPDHRYRKRNTALAAFWMLGPAAAPAIPALTNLMYSTNYRIAEQGASAICATGTNGLPQLVQAITNPAFPARVTVLFSMCSLVYIGTNAGPVIPALLACTHDPDSAVRFHAVRTLGSLPIQLDTVVPALVANFSDPDPDLPRWSIYALTDIGPPARAAVPALLRLFQAPESDLRDQAEVALLKIDPEED